MGNVGSVTVGVRGDSSEFRADMVANQRLVADFAQKAQQAGQQAAAGMTTAADGSAILSKGLAASTAAAGTLTSAMTVLKAAIGTAFPIFGALALLDVLEKIADNKFAQVATNIGDGFRSMNLSLESSADLLKESTAKMQEQLDILSGKRPNLLAEQLADASIEADKLATKLDEDAKKVEQLLTRDHLTAFQGLVTHRAGTADVEGSINSFNEQIAHLAAVYQHAIRTGAPSDQALKDLTDKQAAARDYQQSQLRARQEQQAKGIGFNQDANIAALTGYGDTLTDIGDYAAAEKASRDTAIKLRSVQDQNKADAMQREAERKAASAEKKAQEDLLKQDEEAEKAQNAFNKLTINEEIAFWNDRISAYTKGSDEYFKVEDRVYDLIAKRPSLSAVNKKNQAEAGKSQVQGDDLMRRGSDALRKIQEDQYERSARSTQQYNSEVAKGNAEQEKAKTALSETNIQIALAQGSISQLGAAEALAAIHAHNHAAGIDIVNQKLAEQIRLINEMPDDKMSADDKANAIRNAQQAAANQTTALNGAYAITQAGDQQTVRDQQLGPGMQDTLRRMGQDWSNMTQSIIQITTRALDSFNDDLAKLATGHGSKADFGRTFTQAGEGLVKTALQSYEGNIFKTLFPGKAGTKKPTGAQGDPIHTVSDSAGAGSGILGPHGNDLFRPFFGGQQDGSGGGSGGIMGILKGLLGGGGSILGGMTGGGVGDISGGVADAAGGLGDAIGSVTSLFAGAFANGGTIPAGHHFSLVGERGPELLATSAASRVVPNHELGRAPGGGGNTYHTWHIDARGSSDPAAIHAAVMRAAPHIAASAVHASHSMAKRKPGGR